MRLAGGGWCSSSTMLASIADALTRQKPEAVLDGDGVVIVIAVDHR